MLVRKRKKPHQNRDVSKQKPKEHSVADCLRYQFDALGGYSVSNSCHQASTTTLGESNGSITTLFGMCRLGWHGAKGDTFQPKKERRKRETQKKSIGR